MIFMQLKKLFDQLKEYIVITQDINQNIVTLELYKYYS